MMFNRGTRAGLQREIDDAEYQVRTWEDSTDPDVARFVADMKAEADEGQERLKSTRRFGRRK